MIVRDRIVSFFPGKTVKDTKNEERNEEDVTEFSPTGTLFLLSLYFLLLVALWVFMYFVEFIGRGPTIGG